MSYYVQKKVDLGFDQAIQSVTEELKKEGAEILSVIDVKAKLKEKLDIYLFNYTILGPVTRPS